MAQSLADDFRLTRQFTLQLAKPLSAEDCVVQSMEDASPTRWHLAHTTWFFETFVLANVPGYRAFDPQFNFLFNSYYNTIGAQFPRSQRGCITRPGLQRVLEYREVVDEQILNLLSDANFLSRNEATLRLGLQHEQQHQELILTDIKHALACNPTYPIYQDLPFDPTTRTKPLPAVSIAEGVYSVGYGGKQFSFDNETPRHSTYLHSCGVESQLVTCGQYLDFMNDGGYRRPEYWLSAGWAKVQDSGWQAPMYWYFLDDQWLQFTLAGLKPVDWEAPVTHVSFYEADAYARWREKRLPTEFEWEVAANQSVGCEEDPFVDYFVERQLAIHPTRSPHGMCGAVWQWTSSAYVGYPGYAAPAGAIGEYNGKFMCDQHVLRGGSVAPHSSHIRETYRNFFPAHARWQFSGLRLAE